MKKGFLYRFIVIFLAYLLVGGTLVGVSFSFNPEWVKWLVLGIVIFLFIMTIVINEILWKRKKKKDNEGH
ncbi:MAG: hypothetical protein K5694_03370 [Bacilli bacterium]|nr:hypothetical protein [Bacilli bacterium]